MKRRRERRRGKISLPFQSKSSSRAYLAWKKNGERKKRRGRRREESSLVESFSTVRVLPILDILRAVRYISAQWKRNHEGGGGGGRKMNTQRHTRTNTRTRVYKRLPRRRYDCKVAIKLRKIYCKYIKGGKGMDEKMDWVGKRWKIGSTSNPMDALYNCVRGIISL